MASLATEDRPGKTSSSTRMEVRLERVYHVAPVYAVLVQRDASAQSGAGLLAQGLRWTAAL
jgi:hypothetical protein